MGRLLNLPTLLMPETQDSTSEQIARVGRVEGMTRAGRTWRFRFVANVSLPGIDTARIEDLTLDLRIGQWEFQRTHWAVKDVDLYRAIAPAVTRAPSGPPRVGRGGEAVQLWATLVQPAQPVTMA